MKFLKVTFLKHFIELKLDTKNPKKRLKQSHKTQDIEAIGRSDGLV
jgi:hypothetical protein